MGQHSFTIASIFNRCGNYRDDYSSYQLLTQDSLNIYIFAASADNYFLDIYSKETLKRTNLVKIPLLSPKPRLYSIHNLIIRPHTFLLFYSNFDAHEHVKLRMLAFDGKGNQIGDPKVIYASYGERKVKTFGLTEREKNHEFLSYGYSYTDDSIYLTLNHFDYNGNYTQRQDYSFSHDSTLYLNNYIDSSGNLIYLTFNQTADDRNKFKVYIYSSDSPIPKCLPLHQSSVTNLLAPDLYAIDDSSGQILLLSPFATSYKSHEVDGIYIGTFDRNFSLSEKFVPFKTLKAGNKTIKFGKYGYYSVKEAFHMREGMRIILIENEIDVLKSNRFKQNLSGDIISIDLDNSNEIKAMHVIRKQQQYTNASHVYAGFASLQFKDKNYYVYNELPDNLRKPDKVKQVDLNGINFTEVVYASVENDKVIRKMLIEKTFPNTTDAVYTSKYMRDLSKGEIYILRQIQLNTYLTKIFVNE